VESLKERGIDEEGKLLPGDGEGYKRPRILQELANKGDDVSLTGSMKLHADKPMVAAKYVEFKKETDTIVDALLKALEVDMQRKMGIAPMQHSRPRPSKGFPKRTERPNTSKGTAAKPNTSPANTPRAAPKPVPTGKRVHYKPQSSTRHPIHSFIRSVK
jgi:hypothetical protein